MKLKDSIKQDLNLMAVLLIPVCVAINMVGFQLAQILRLPIYLDTIGTVLVGIIAGPWIAILTGFLTNCINAIFNPVYLPYSVVSIAIGLTAAILSKKKMFTSWGKIFISGVIISLVATVTASPITVILFGGITGSTGSMITAGFLATGHKIWTAVFSAQFITEIVDKQLCVFICVLIVRRISSRYLSKLKNGHLYIKDEELDEKDI